MIEITLRILSVPLKLYLLQKFVNIVWNYIYIFVSADRLPFSLFGDNVRRVEESESAMSRRRRENLQLHDDGDGGWRRRGHHRGGRDDRSSSHGDTKYISDGASKVSIYKYAIDLVPAIIY